MVDPALIVFCGGLAVWMAGEAALTSLDRPAAGTLALPTGALVLVGHVVGVVEYLGHGSSAWAIAAGGALFVAGVGLRLWSIAALGPAFATALDAARLITSGPYRWMRHPSEAGLIAAMIGGNVLLASRLAWLATAAAIPLAMIRCGREDAVLARRHVGAYAAWAAAVGWFWRRS
jgi:protein-S-isoprenylcysteine O-methyltransferase